MNPALMAHKFSKAAYAQDELDVKNACAKYNTDDVRNDISTIITTMRKDPALCNIAITPTTVKSYISHLMRNENLAERRHAYFTNHIDADILEYQKVMCYMVDMYYADVHTTSDELIPGVPADFLYVYQYDDFYVSYYQGAYSVSKQSLMTQVSDIISASSDIRNMVVRSNVVLNDYQLNKVYNNAVSHNVWLDVDTISASSKIVDKLISAAQDHIFGDMSPSLDVYTDASVSPYHKSTAVAVAVTLDGDYTYHVIDKKSSKISSMYAELQAIQLALQAYVFSTRKLTVHSDCLFAIKMIKNYVRSPYDCTYDIMYMDTLKKIARLIESAQYCDVHFKHVPSHGKSDNKIDRAANDVADRIAKVIRHSGNKFGRKIQITNILEEYQNVLQKSLVVHSS